MIGVEKTGEDKPGEAWGGVERRTGHVRERKWGEKSSKQNIRGEERGRRRAKDRRGGDKER